MDENHDVAIAAHDAPVDIGLKNPPTAAALPPGGRTLTHFAKARIISGHLKSATFGKATAEGGRTVDDPDSFEILCDEPPFIGGDGLHPQPLNYVASGIGFCLLTQVARYAKMKKLVITRAEAHIEIDLYIRGSVLRGDIDAGSTALRSHLILDSPESPQDLAEVIRLAKRGCFAEQLVARAVPVESTFEVNGLISDIDVS